MKISSYVFYIYIYDLVELVLHQHNVIFGSRDLAATAHFSAWASASRTRSCNHAHTSKTLRTRYNPHES